MVVQIRCVFVEIRTFLKDGVELFIGFNDHRILMKEEILPLYGRSSRNVQCPAADQADPPPGCSVCLVPSVLKIQLYNRWEE